MNLCQDSQQKNCSLIYTKLSFRPFQQPEINAPKTTIYDFYACLLFGGSIKVTTGFLIGDIGHNPFFLA